MIQIRILNQTNSTSDSRFEIELRIKRIWISNQTNYSNFRAAALSTYHRYECKIMDFLIASGNFSVISKFREMDFPMGQAF